MDTYALVFGNFPRKSNLKAMGCAILWLVGYIDTSSYNLALLLNLSIVSSSPLEPLI